MSKRTKAWTKAAIIRAIRTMAQTMVALIGTNNILLTEVDWKGIISAAALAGILSVLTSIAGLPEVDTAEVHDLTTGGRE